MGTERTLQLDEADAFACGSIQCVLRLMLVCMHLHCAHECMRMRVRAWVHDACGMGCTHRHTCFTPHQRMSVLLTLAAGGLIAVLMKGLFVSSGGFDELEELQSQLLA